jgi:acylphosphatase
MRRVRVVVSGRVQGVFFRASCADEAARLGVAGWIRNGPGGRVEAAFEGADAAVDEIVAWCRRGPPTARVDGVEVSEETPAGETRFRVTR